MKQLLPVFEMATDTTLRADFGRVIVKLHENLNFFECGGKYIPRT